MSLTVELVNSFISRVESKAVSHVIGEAKKQLQAAVLDEIITNEKLSGIKELTEEIDELMDRLADNIRTLDTMLVDGNQNKLRGSLNYNSPIILLMDRKTANGGDDNHRLNLLSVLEDAQIFRSADINKIICARDEKTKGIRRTYQALDSELKGKSAKSRMTYLESAGFDVTKLKEWADAPEVSLKLNKDLLFPCKENS